MSDAEPLFGRKRCLCLLKCQCRETEKYLSDWVKKTTFEAAKNRLHNYTDATEIFARFACILFHREILNGTPIKCMRHNLQKTVLAFQYAGTFVDENVDCLSFYLSCWAKFQQLAERVNIKLSHLSPSSRRFLTVEILMEELFSLHEENREPVQVPLQITPMHGTASFYGGPLALPTEVMSQAVQEVLPSSARLNNLAPQPITPFNNNEATFNRSVPPMRSLFDVPLCEEDPHLVEILANGGKEIKPEPDEQMRPTITTPTPAPAFARPPTPVHNDEPLVQIAREDANKEPKIESEEIIVTKVIGPKRFFVKAESPAREDTPIENDRDSDADDDVYRFAADSSEKGITFSSLVHDVLQRTRTSSIQSSVARNAKDRPTTSRAIVTSSARNERGAYQGCRYKCPFEGCKRQFKFKWILKRHVKVHHGGQRCNFVCEECGMDFPKEQDVTKHNGVHDPNNANVCGQCDFRFLEARHLSQHKSKYHARDPKNVQTSSK